MKSCSRFQFSIWSVSRRSLVSNRLSRISDSNPDEFQRLVELLEVVDQQMSPRPIHRLLLADNSFLKIEAALTPPENFGDGRLTSQGTVGCVANRALLQIDFTVPTR